MNSIFKIETFFNFKNNEKNNVDILSDFILFNIFKCLLYQIKFNNTKNKIIFT